MASLLSNYFQSLEGTHSRQKQTAITNPELASVRADVDNLMEKTQKLASVVDMLFDAADKAAAATPLIVEKFFKDRGIKARLVKDRPSGADSTSPVAAIFGTKALSRRQTESCQLIFGDKPFCRGEGPAQSKTANVVYQPTSGKMPMRQWLALVTLLGPDQALIFKAENGIVVEEPDE